MHTCMRKYNIIYISNGCATESRIVHQKYGNLISFDFIVGVYDLIKAKFKNWSPGALDNNICASIVHKIKIQLIYIL